MDSSGLVPLFLFLLSFAVFFDTGFWNAPTFSSPNGNISRLAQNLKVTALASRAAGTVEGYQRAFNRWKSFASQTLRVPCFPVSPTNFALYIQYLLERTGSASTINTAFYAINWAHKLAGLESPTDHPTVLLIKEGAVRTCSPKSNRKEPLEPDHLKGLARQTNFEDLLQLRSLVMYVLSFCGFLRSAEILELRRNSISFKSDHMEISILKSKTDQLRQGEILVIAKTEGDLCPVNLLQLYLSKAGIPDNSTEYVFRPISSSKKQKKLVSSDRHISYSTYRESFKASFKGIVPDISKYSTHSTRSGEATIAANSGVKERVFQRHGRWKTKTAKDLYVKDSVYSRLNVSKSLGL